MKGWDSLDLVWFGVLGFIAVVWGSWYLILFLDMISDWIST